MSIKAVAWALDQSISSHGTKLLLIVLANYANADGIAWPSQATLQDKCCAGRKSIIRWLADLEDEKYILRVRRGGDGAGRKSNLYRLLLDRANAQTGAQQNAPDFEHEQEGLSPPDDTLPSSIDADIGTPAEGLSPPDDTLPPEQSPPGDTLPTRKSTENGVRNDGLSPPDDTLLSAPPVESTAQKQGLSPPGDTLPTSSTAQEADLGGGKVPLVTHKPSVEKKEKKEREEREEKKESVSREKPKPEKPTRKPKTRTSSAGTRLDIEALPREWSEWSAANTPGIDAGRTWERFADYWRGVPGARGRKADWQATWRNWCRREADNKQARYSNAPADKFSRRAAINADLLDQARSPFDEMD